ncbi:ATP-dependent RNA helicase DHX58-like [Diadema setosum]|uniref:ATP-dependent RNA helicase DHX58-like n=1 Tax=Diadema setosum TaxID=31175 RepID=UPI003B3B94E2
MEQCVNARVDYTQTVSSKKREYQISETRNETEKRKKFSLSPDVETDAVSTYPEPPHREKPKEKDREHDDEDEKDVCEKGDDDDMDVAFKEEPQNFEIEGKAAQSDIVECEDLQTSASFLEEEEDLPEVDSKSFEAVKEEGEWPALEVAKELNEAKEKKEKEEAAIQYDETTGIEVNLFARMKADPSSLTSKDRDLIQKQMMKHLERKAAPPESKEPKVEFDPDKKLLPYQHELAAPGLMGFNYIMCAPVGTGKALTAAAICNHQRKIAIAKKEEKPYKSLFVSSGQSVSDRHRDAFQNIFPPGAVSVLESPSQFKEVFDLPSVHVVMLTAEQLSQVLKERQIAFIDLTTVVIDECHLIATKHPFNDITKYYLAEKKDLLARKAPRGAWTLGRPYGGISFIIGLTPNLGANLQCFTREFMVRQCGLLDSKGIRRVESVDNLREMLKVNKPPEVDTMLLTLRAQSTINSVFRSVLEKLMSSMEERYSPDGGLQGDTPRKGTKEYRAWIHPKRMLAKQLGEVDRYFPATYLVLLNDALCVHEDLRCKEAMKFLSSEDGKLQAEKGFAASTGKDCHKMFEEQKFELMRLVKEDLPGLSPKLWCLAQKLAEIYEKDAPEAGIILVRSSAIATLLVNIINSNNITSSKGIKAVQLSDPDEGEMEDRDSVVSQQIKIFQDIQQGKANLIVCTDFEQTGLELPSCHFVIRYNLVEEEVRTVQRAARAGAGEGLCFLIAEKYSNLAYEEQRKRDNLKSLESNLKVLNEMDPKKWYDLVEDKQLAAIRQSAQQDFLRLYQRSSRRPQDYNLLCKNCRKNICNAHYLLRRGDQISCTDSSIKERLKISPLSNSLRTRNHAVTGVLKCTGQVNGRPCENKLGVAVDFFRQTRQEGYGLDVRAFFFSYLEGQSAGYVGQEFSSWDEVDFYIRTEVIPDRSGRTGTGGGRRDDGDDDDDDDNDSRGNRRGSRGNRSTSGSEKEKMDTSNGGRTETSRGRNGGGGESDSNEKRNGGKKRDPRYDPDDGDVER